MYIVFRFLGPTYIRWEPYTILNYATIVGLNLGLIGRDNFRRTNTSPATPNRSYANRQV